MQSENSTPEITGCEPGISDQDWEKSDKAVAKMLAAVMAAKSAKTSRELAHARVRIHEPAITKMLSAGVSQASILECLVNAMPSIPKPDLRAALEAIRFRLIRERKKSDVPPAQGQVDHPLLASKTGRMAENAGQARQNRQPEQTTEAPQVKQTIPPQPAADGSDRMPGESEDDYQLRKSLEPKPDRRKFIGEGD